MTDEHTKYPFVVNKELGNIAKTPFAASCGKAFVRLDHYIRQWRQQQNLFSYSGPGGDDGSSRQPKEDESGTYYLHLPAPGRDQTSNERLLHGAILLWAWDGSSTDAKIEYTDPDGGSAVTLWEKSFSQGGAYGSYDHDRSTGIETMKNYLFNLSDPDFKWAGTGARFFQAKIDTTNCFVAALSVWTAADYDGTIDADDNLVELEDCRANQPIKAWEAGYPNTGLGDIIRNVATISTYSDESDLTVANRCLLQSGHPTGIQTTSSSYVNIRGGGDSYFRIRPSNPRGNDSVEAYAAITVSCTGAGEADPARVRFTALDSSDTLVFELTSNVTTTLYYSASTMTLDGTADDNVSIEFHAPSSGTIVLHTYSVWEDITSG